MKSRNIITSPSNQHIKNLALLLKKAKAREEQGLFVIEGIKMFQEARNLHIIANAYVTESFYLANMANDTGFLKDLDYEVVSDSLLKKISDTISPQGIMATVATKKMEIKKPELTKLLEKDKTFLLFLEDIRDPGNLGTMIRTGEGAGITGIIMNASCVDLYNPKVVRSTMGSIFRVPVYYSTDFIKTLDIVKQHSIAIYAAHLRGKPYDMQDNFIKSCGILIGNEAKGLTKEASMKADCLVKIPMEGKVESMNAAIAAGILMYEVSRQRREEYSLLHGNQ